MFSFRVVKATHISNPQWRFATKADCQSFFATFCPRVIVIVIFTSENTSNEDAHRQNQPSQSRLSRAKLYVIGQDRQSCRHHGRQDEQNPIETWCEASYVWLPREDLKMSQNLGPSKDGHPAWMPKRYRTRHCRAWHPWIHPRLSGTMEKMQTTLCTAILRHYVQQYSVWLL